MAAQVCKNGVFDVFSFIYSFQFRIKMHGLMRGYFDIYPNKNIYSLNIYFFA